MKMKRTKFAFANHSFTKLDQVFLELIFICVQHHLTPVSSNRLFSFLFFYLRDNLQKAERDVLQRTSTLK